MPCWLYLFRWVWPPRSASWNPNSELKSLAPEAICSDSKVLRGREANHGRWPKLLGGLTNVGISFSFTHQIRWEFTGYSSLESQANSGHHHQCLVRHRINYRAHHSLQAVFPRDPAINEVRNAGVHEEGEGCHVVIVENKIANCGSSD